MDFNLACAFLLRSNASVGCTAQTQELRSPHQKFLQHRESGDSIPYYVLILDVERMHGMKCINILIAIMGIIED